MSRNPFASAAGRSTTMLPFLYQTRTLMGLHGIRKLPVSQYRYINSIRRRQFSQHAARCFPSDQQHDGPASTNEPPRSLEKNVNKGHGGFTIRRVVPRPVLSDSERFSFSYRSSNDQKSVRSDDESTGWEAGGLYGTTGKGRFGRNMAYDNKGSEDSDIPWGEPSTADFEAFEESDGEAPEESESGNEHEEGPDEIENLTRKSASRQDEASTITPSERIAFQKIFSDIFARSQSDSPFGHEGLLGQPESQSPGGEGKKGSAKAKSAANEFIDNTSKSRQEIEAAVNRYPAPLRAAAARAMGLIVEAPKQTVPELESTTASYSEEESEQALEEEKLEQLRKPECDRVENLMRSARTDFELWAVMQKEVFPLISKLGLEESPEIGEEAAPKKTRAPSKKSKSKAKENPEQPGVPLDSPVEGMSPLEFYGPLYPSYLLLGLRLLDRSFARPSPLTLAVLPAIKSLGLISHVLGGTSQLYNELLLIHWYRYDDFRGVLSLLNEMEQFGLDWDQDTRGAIMQITRVQKAVRDGNRGKALKSLWSLPEFAPGRFKTWQSKIEQALAEEQSRNAPRAMH